MRGSRYMSKGTRLAGLLLLTTSLTFPAALHAQDQGQPVTDQTQEEAVEETQEDEIQDAAPDVSIPGGGIVVVGRRNRDPERSSTQVLNVLDEEAIARSGEGDIAGALGRVTGRTVDVTGGQVHSVSF